MTEKDLFPIVTDAGSDVKHLCLKLLSSRWESCCAHPLNAALVEVKGIKSGVLIFFLCKLVAICM